MKNIKQIHQNTIEYIGLICIYLILVCNVIFFKDDIVAFISAFFGITYTFLAGKGKPCCYLFGLTGSCFYCYLDLCNALWGQLALYLAYFIPMQIIGFFKWKKHLKNDKNEIIKTEFSKKHRLILYSFTAIISIVAIISIYYLNGKSPIMDGITATFSITAMYLTVRRAIEQWHIWMLVNGLSAIMWFLIVLNGTRAYSTVTMWSVYFILAIYFYLTWKKDKLSINQRLI